MSTESLDLAALKDNLSAHYFECDRFEVYNYGTRQGKCDCTATADFEALIAEVERLREALDEVRALHAGEDCDCASESHPSCVACEDNAYPCETARILASLDADHTDTKEQTR